MQHWLVLGTLGQAVAEVQLQQGDSQQLPVQAVAEVPLGQAGAEQVPVLCTAASCSDCAAVWNFEMRGKQESRCLLLTSHSIWGEDGRWWGGNRGQCLCETKHE